MKRRLRAWLRGLEEPRNVKEVLLGVSIDEAELRGLFFLDINGCEELALRCPDWGFECFGEVDTFAAGVRKRMVTAFLFAYRLSVSEPHDSRPTLPTATGFHFLHNVPPNSELGAIFSWICTCT